MVSGSVKSFYKVVLRVLTLLCICVCGLKRASPHTHTFVTFWAKFLSFSSAWFCCRCCGRRLVHSKVPDRLLLDPSSLFSLLTCLLSGGCCCYIFRLKTKNYPTTSAAKWEAAQASVCTLGAPSLILWWTRLEQHRIGRRLSRWGTGSEQTALQHSSLTLTPPVLYKAVWCTDHSVTGLRSYLCVAVFLGLTVYWIFLM